MCTHTLKFVVETFRELLKNQNKQTKNWMVKVFLLAAWKVAAIAGASAALLKSEEGLMVDATFWE